MPSIAARLSGESDDLGEDTSGSLYIGQPDDLAFTNSTQGDPLVSPDDLRMGSDRGSNSHMVFRPQRGFDDNQRGILRQRNRNHGPLDLVGPAAPRLG